MYFFYLRLQKHFHNISLYHIYENDYDMTSSCNKTTPKQPKCLKFNTSGKKINSFKHSVSTN